MDLKKSNIANLETRKGVHIILGLIISLSLILISFEWTTLAALLTDVNAAHEIDIGFEIIELIPREEPKLKQELPPIDEVIQIVDDEYEIEVGYSYDREAVPGTRKLQPGME